MLKTTENIRDNKIKKTFRVNQDLLDEVRHILGTHTETETIERALEQIRFKTDLRKWIDRTSGRFPHL